MNNKRGFTLVELLAVIVILALIMSIALISIGGILRSSRESTMKETAAIIIEGVEPQLIINNNLEEGDYYFNKGIVERGLDESPLGGNYVVGFSSCTNENRVGENLCKTSGATCTDKSVSFVRVTKRSDEKYEYSICLTAGEGNYYIDLASESALLDNSNVSMIKKEGEDSGAGDGGGSNTTSGNSNEPTPENPPVDPTPENPPVDPTPQEPTIPTCPGATCVYTKSKNTLNRAIRGTLGTDYKTTYSDYGNYFLGHILEGTTVKESYACGINSGKVFCLRGGLSETDIYNENIRRLNVAYPSCNATTTGSSATCYGAVYGEAYGYGYVVVYSGTSICYVTSNGVSKCD